MANFSFVSKNIISGDTETRVIFKEINLTRNLFLVIILHGLVIFLVDTVDLVSVHKIWGNDKQIDNYDSKYIIIIVNKRLYMVL